MERFKECEICSSVLNVLLVMPLAEVLRTNIKTINANIEIFIKIEVL